MKKSINRRELLAGFAALTGTRLLPTSIPVSLALMPTAVQANPWAAASLGLTVATTIMGMNAKGGGLGEQFAALNLKLDQVLKNQEHIMLGIGELQKSIDQLGLHIEGLLVKDRFKDVLTNTEALKDNMISFLAATNPETNPGFVMNEYKAEDFYDYAREMRTLASKINKEIEIASLKKEDIHLGGTGILLTLLPSLLTIISVMDAFRSIKNTHPDLRLENIEYTYMSQEIKTALNTLKDHRIPEAFQAQVSEAHEAYGVVNGVAYWAPVDQTFPANATQSEGRSFASRCWRSRILPYQTKTDAEAPNSIIYNYHEYRLTKQYDYSYKTQIVPGLQPIEYIVTDVKIEGEKQDIATGNHWAPSKTPPNVGNNFQYIPGPLDVATHCADGLEEIVPATIYTYATDNPTKIIAGFDDFLLKLPRFSNALISQYQLLGMQKLTDVLLIALEKFDKAVSIDVKPVSKLQTLAPKP